MKDTIPLTTFKDLGLAEPLLKALTAKGYETPTPIQAQSWAVALRGSDLISIAKTGSGKTCGFLLPGFMHCAATRRDPRVGPTMTVLAPTRELAVQIKEEADKFGRSGGFRNTCCYGESIFSFFFFDLESSEEEERRLEKKDETLTSFSLFLSLSLSNLSSSSPLQAAPPRARSSVTSALASSSSSPRRGASTTSSREAWSACTR